jgi:hypothetical protein
VKNLIRAIAALAALAVVAPAFAADNAAATTTDESGKMATSKKMGKTKAKSHKHHMAKAKTPAAAETPKAQ